MQAIEVKAFAPASVGNVAVGFDLIGHSLHGLGDTVTVRRTDAAGVLDIEIRGCEDALPTDPERNTAGRAIQSLLAHCGSDCGVDIIIEKGIPLAAGLGGSAASAVAAVVAVNRLLDFGLDAQALYPHALAGEAVASGAAHGDNVGPQLLGGLVLCLADRLVPLPVPDGLIAAVVHPHCRVATREARALLAAPFELGEVTAQQANLALVLSGCYAGDLERIARGLEDVLIEPRRSHLIPGFETVKRAALDHGAMGCSISGAGPSVFAWFPARTTADPAAAAMQAAFRSVGLESDAVVSTVAGPAARIESVR